MSDLINRQEAIKVVQKWFDRIKLNGDICLDGLRSLPSVEPERKLGKWLLTIEDWNKWTCSECGFSKRTDIHVTLGYDYCPKCGSRMEVDG